MNIIKDKEAVKKTGIRIAERMKNTKTAERIAPSNNTKLSSI
jgi:hypothetical protein